MESLPKDKPGTVVKSRVNGKQRVNSTIAANSTTMKTQKFGVYFEKGRVTTNFLEEKYLSGSSF